MDPSWEQDEEMLRRFRPQAVSADKRQEIVDQIKATRTRRRVVMSLGALLALAGCLLVVVTIQPNSRDTAVPAGNQVRAPKQSELDPTAVAAKSTERPAPTLWAYRRAAVGSLDEFDSLLSRHSQVLLTPDQTKVGFSQRPFP